MTAEEKAIRAAYLRNWRKANPEKVRAQKERYWQRKAAAMKEEQTGKEDGGGDMK